jgi:hypothetical protein
MAAALALGVAFGASFLARGRRVVVGVVVGVVLAVIGLSLRAPTSAGDVAIAPGVSLWVVDGSSVLTTGGRVPNGVPDALRSRRIHRLDVLVVERPGKGAADAAWPIISAFRPRVVLAPEHHQVAGAHTARAGAVVLIGRVEVRVIAGGPPLRVTVSRRLPSGA